MIISASRRTDVPAFYGEWLMNRIKAGYCHVANPFNPKQVSRVSLAVPDVEAIVFWSKNPAPLLPHLDELDKRGFRYCFLYTLNDYPGELEPYLPPLADRIQTFASLSRRLGSDRVIWRYDPVILSNRTDVAYHERAFTHLARQLHGYTHRVIVSVLDLYRKTDRSLQTLASHGYIFDRAPLAHPELPRLLQLMQTTAAENGISMQSCAEGDAFAAAGIPRGACIDMELLHKLWGLPIQGKDPNQRPACGCAIAKDIGAPDSCLHGCVYCYATRSHDAAQCLHARHNPRSSVLAGEDPEKDQA